MLPIDITQPISDFLLMVNSNRGRITYRLRDIFVYRGWKSSFFAHYILTVDSQWRNAQQYQGNLYIDEKYFACLS